MKKIFLIVSTVIFFAASIVFIQSCSKDSYTDDFISSSNNFTEQEKAKILQLADKYGLNISLHDEITGKKPLMKEIENEFRALASIKGKYEFVKIGDNKVISRKKLSKSTPRFKSNAESGSWSGDNFGDGLEYTVTINVSWNFKEYPYQVDITGGIEHPIIPLGAATISMGYRIVGAEPYDIDFDGSISAPIGAYGYVINFDIVGRVSTGEMPSGGFVIIN